MKKKELPKQLREARPRRPRYAAEGLPASGRRPRASDAVPTPHCNDPFRAITDERVNMVTRELFVKYKTPADLARASQEELEQEIRSTGFFRMKARNIIACSKETGGAHGGEVPASMETLVQLAGVGRKTANVVLGQAFGIAVGHCR